MTFFNNFKRLRRISAGSCFGVDPQSRGFAFKDYTFTMWVRKRVNPALDGTNAELADSIPDASGFTARVPEPASWAMLIVGFGLSGAVLRRRRTVMVAA